MGKESKLVSLAKELADGYLASDAFKQGRAINLRGMGLAFQHVLFGELTRYFVQRGTPVVVLTNANGNGFYSIDVDYFKKRMKL